VSDEPSTAELIDLIRQGVASGIAFEGEKGIEEIAALLTELAHPDFLTVMVPQHGPAREFTGIDGFREALTDWISPYESFRLQIDDVIERPDKLLFLARQIGTTKHGGVEVEIAGASLWSLADGRVSQTTFYLDRDAALRATGIDPGETPDAQ
jgi:ketosteroid isomerase-like protein